MKKNFIALLFVAALFIGCEKDDPYADIQADYEVAVDEEFQIEMNSNPTTGYSWAWINKSSVSIVDTVGWNYVANSTGGMMGGNDGKETWKFVGVSKGLDTLIFDYRQSWDAASASDTTSYIVRVK